jgi:hypothetical protein
MLLRNKPLKLVDELKGCLLLMLGKKGKGGCYNRRPVKKFCELGNRNVALNGVAAELRAYMRSSVS